MNRKAIIWGAGTVGKNVYYKISDIWQVAGFCDGNSDKWNQKFLGENIYSPEEAIRMAECDIIVTGKWHEEIIERILEMGGKEEKIYYVSPKSYILQSFNEEHFPQQDNNKMRVLFVQASPGIRIDKIASVLKNNGIRSDAAYLTVPPSLSIGMQKTSYEKIIPINDLKEFLQYVNNSAYDVVWSANEPDYLTTLLLNSNKPVIHDTADMMSLRGDISIEQMIHEYIANRKSHGNVYVSDMVKQIADEKFGIEGKETFLLNNYVLCEEKPEKYLPKLSATDGEVHCVYEGGISSNTRYHRYYEDMFHKIAQNQIHVHFYGQCFEGGEYCSHLESLSPYLHYEGCISYEKLQTEMTQYDIGLVLLNITPRNRMFLQTTFPNKIFEYLYAGLPVAVSNIDSLIQFVRKYGVGDYLDFTGNISEQLNRLSCVEIERDFLEKNRLTMDAQAEDLICFLKRVCQLHRG